MIQNTVEACTDLVFSVVSPHESEELILYPEGPCKDAPLSQRKVTISFSPCSCPIGFEPQLPQQTKCECLCDSWLHPYISDCSPQTETLVRQGNFWVTYINNSENSGGYLLYPNCPMDYCHPPGTKININLNIENGADAQCTLRHSGLLCGKCLPGLSLSLGSSHCIQCPTYWPVTFAAILIAAILGGMALVA